MSSGHQRIRWRKNIAENFNRLSRVHQRYRRQTTDERRQTNGRTTTYSEHEHEFTFANHEYIITYMNKIENEITSYEKKDKTQELKNHIRKTE